MIVLWDILGQPPPGQWLPMTSSRRAPFSDEPQHPESQEMSRRNHSLNPRNQVWDSWDFLPSIFTWCSVLSRVSGLTALRHQFSYVCFTSPTENFWYSTVFCGHSLQWPSFNHRNLPEILGKFYPKSVSRMRSKGFSFVFVGPGGGVLASRLSNRNNSQRRRSGCVAGNALFCVAGVALCDIRRVWSCVGIFGVTGAIFLNGLDRMTFIFRSTRST